MWLDSVQEAIGRTPLVRLNTVANALPCPVLAKVEYFNPGQSVKDRVALGMIRAAERRGELLPGGTIVEATSGNTGMGVALVGRARGYRCILAVKDSVSQPKIDALEALGVEVVLCPAGAKPEDPASYFRTAERIADEIPGAVFLNQYENPANPQAHFETLGPEIWEQTNGMVTYYVASMGTCGTLVGAGKFLKSKRRKVQVIGVDVPGSVLAPFYHKGYYSPEDIHPYKTEAVGRKHIPGVYDGSVIDDVLQVTDADGIRMARRLAKEEQLLCGWSCGTAVAGVLQLSERLRPSDLVVVLLPDHGSRYLGNIYNNHWLLENGLAAALEPEHAFA